MTAGELTGRNELGRPYPAVPTDAVPVPSADAADAVAVGRPSGRVVSTEEHP